MRASLARSSSSVSFALGISTHYEKSHQKNVCWLVFIAICVFHAWFDGRNGTLMHELQRQGQSLDTAREQLHWLCTPLNIATLTVLVLIVTLSVKWKRSG